MAEFMNERSERDSSEYEQMKQYKIRDDHSIQEIIKKRNQFETKLSKPEKDSKAYLDYIRFEWNLILTIRTASVSVSVSNPSAVSPSRILEHSIGHRVLSLYRQAVLGFPQDSRLWESYMNFCKTFRAYANELEAVINKMVTLTISHSPKMWLVAMKNAYEDLNDVDKYRILFNRALLFHPGEKQLYLDAFNYELKEQFEKGKTGQNCADVLYDMAPKRIVDDIQFMIDLLEICEKYRGSDKYQKTILGHMMEDKFKMEPLLYNTLARREMRGFHMSNAEKGQPFQAPVNMALQEKVPSVIEDDENSGYSKLQKDRVILGIKVYEMAITQVNTMEMWTYFLNTVVDLNNDNTLPRVPPAFCRKIVSEAFCKANESDKMSAKNYQQYIEILKVQKPKDDTLLNVLEKATKLHPLNVELWDLFLRYHISHNRQDQVMVVFRQANENLGHQSAQLWRLLFYYLQTMPQCAFDWTKQYQVMDAMFKEVVEYPEKELDEFKLQYVEFIALTRGIKHAREVYESIYTKTPFSFELHKKMAHLESMQLKPDIEAWRSVYKRMTAQFGKDNSDAWIEFIKFERDYSNDGNNMSTVFEQGKLALGKPEDVENLITQFSMHVHMV